MDVTGKLVVVTGAARGLGRACASEFARPGAQAAVGARQDCSATPAAVYGMPGGLNYTTEGVGDTQDRDLEVTLPQQGLRGPLRARDVVAAPLFLASGRGRLTTERTVRVGGGTLSLRTGAGEPNGKDLR